MGFGYNVREMKFGITTLYASILIAIPMVVLLAANLARRGQRRWLRYYQYYVITFSLLEFLNLVAVFITRNTLSGAPADLIRKATVGIYIMVLPLAPIPFYFLLLAAMGLFAKHLAARWKHILAVLYAAFILWEIFSAYGFFSNGDEIPIMFLGQIVNSVSMAAFILILVSVLITALFHFLRETLAAARGPAHTRREGK